MVLASICVKWRKAGGSSAEVRTFAVGDARKLLVEVTEDIKRGRRKRIHGIQWQR